MKLVLGVYDKTPHPYHLDIMGGLDGWILSDIYPRYPNIEKIDARNIPYRNIERIYASHVLEHIRYDEVYTTLKHWKECLKNGGRLDINVPDIEWALDAWMKLNSGETVNPSYFNSKEMVLKIFDGTKDSEYDVHKSWFNNNKLKMLLVRAGYNKIEIKKVVEAHEMGCLVCTAYA